MANKVSKCVPGQKMQREEFDIQHKRDTYLKDVELHHHDFFEIYYLVSGDVVYTIESKSYQVMPGDLLLISPRELHQVYIRPDMAPYERYVLWVDSALVERLSTASTDLGQCLNPSEPGYRNYLHLAPEQSFAVRDLMETIYRETQEGGYGSDVLRDSSISQLLVRINRQVQKGESQTELYTRSSRIVEEVVNYVNIHYRENITLDGLAEQFFVSKYHLSHEFRRYMGIGIYRYVQKKRLQIAVYGHWHLSLCAEKTPADRPPASGTGAALQCGLRPMRFQRLCRVLPGI